MIFPGCTLVYYLINYTKERIMMKKLQLRRGFVDHPFLSFCLRETSHQPDWPLLKKLKLMNNCKKRNYSCKQFVIYVEEACFIWVCLVQCNHCTFHFLLNLCTGCSLYNRCIIPGATYHYKVLSVNVIQDMSVLFE